MLSQVTRRGPHALVQNTRSLFSSARVFQEENVESKKKWRIDTAVCLERYPRIVREKTPFEKKYDIFKATIALEKSSYSQLEFDQEKELADLQKKKSKSDENNFMASFEVSTEEVFTTADRITSADVAKDYKSLRRCLQEKLFLLVKLKRKDFPWRMPQTTLGAGESIRQGAQRALKDVVDTASTETYFIGNAPSCVQTYEFNSSYVAKDNTTGTKVFFLRSALVSPLASLTLDSSYDDYAWLTRDEIQQYVSPAYYDCIKKFLF